ncbi:MAG: hypothetical protein QXV83_01735 [Candidatus Anstonellaceae archaeon]
MKFALKNKRQNSFFTLDVEALEDLHKYLNSISLPTQTNQISNFHPFFIYLNSLKYSSISWKELVEGKKEFVFKNYTYPDLLELKNIGEKLKEFGFNYSLSIKNGFILFSISLNISKEQKEKLNNLIKSGKTPFSSFLSNEFRERSYYFPPADNTYVKNTSPYYPDPINTKPENEFRERSYDFPADKTYVDQRYLVTNDGRVVRTSGTGGLSLSESIVEVSKAFFNFFVSVDSIENIFKGTASKEDYFMVGFDLLTFVGFSLAIKLARSSVKYFRGVKKLVSSSELRKSFQTLPKGIKFFAISSEENLALFLKEPTKFTNLFLQNCKKASKKTTEKILRGIESGKYINVDNVIFKGNKVIGFFDEAGTFYKLNKPLLVARSIFTGFNAYWAYTLVDKAISGDESFKEDLKYYFITLGSFSILSKFPTIFKMTMDYLKKGEPVEKIVSLLEKKFKIRDSNLRNELKLFVNKTSDLFKKYGFQKVFNGISLVLYYSTPIYISNMYVDSKNSNIAIPTIQNPSNHLLISDCQRFSSSFALPFDDFMSLNPKYQEAYKEVLDKFGVKVKIENEALYLIFTEEFIPPKYYPSEPAVKFWEKVFQEAEKDNSTQPFSEKVKDAFNKLVSFSSTKKFFEVLDSEE